MLYEPILKISKKEYEQTATVRTGEIFGNNDAGYNVRYPDGGIAYNIPGPAGMVRGGRVSVNLSRSEIVSSGKRTNTVITEIEV